MDKVFLSGSSGFVGGHVLRELVAAGYSIRALVRGASTGGASGGVEFVHGDLENVGAFARAVDGCRYVVHCAALYSFTPRDRARMHRVNVLGAASLIEAAHLAGVERFVLTSSSAAVGAVENGRLRTESDWAQDDGPSGYHHSKLDQERAAWAGRVPLIALLPTAPVGPGDAKPTPTGQMILDYARGRMFSMPPPGGMNLVPVEDVARAHVAALTLGLPGSRYILGGENLSLDEIWQLLADVTGKPLPSIRVPHAVAMAIAYADEARCRLIPGARPAVPLEGVRMAAQQMYVDSTKAQRELAFNASAVRDAILRSVQWYQANHYV